MIQSIFYKEWLKIGKVTIFLFVLALLILSGVYLSVRHDLILNDAQVIWDRIVNQKYLYFSMFKFVPLISGLLIGIAQFLPEMTEKRIKLSLHLPLNEEEIVLKMVAIGAFTVMLQFLALGLIFYIWGTVYFPSEILLMAMLTLIPWFLSGVGAYFLVSFILLEPVWKYRLVYLVIGAVFITLFFQSDVAGAYRPSLVELFLFIGMISISSILSTYRFRKGEM